MVHLHPEQREVGADHRPSSSRSRTRAPPPASPTPAGRAGCRRSCAFSASPTGDQVVARIQPLGDLGLQAAGLAVALVGRARQHVDLRAAVVDVVLPRHVDSRRSRAAPPARRRTPRRATWPDMHRPGRVGRDELDVDPPAAAQRRAAEGPALRSGSPAAPPNQTPGVEPQVQEARPRHLGADHAGASAQRARRPAPRRSRAAPCAPAAPAPSPRSSPCRRARRRAAARP